jgi:hypothetical protein
MLENILIYDQTPNLDPHRRAQTQLPPIAAGRRRSPSFAEPSLTFYWGSNSKVRTPGVYLVSDMVRPPWHNAVL